MHAGHAPQNFSVPDRKRACPVNKVVLPYLVHFRLQNIAINEITTTFLFLARFDAMLKKTVHINKAGYKAIQSAVADGWAGAVMPKKRSQFRYVTDGWTDGPTR